MAEVDGQIFMNNLMATLYCSNPRCQAANPQDYNFCQKCRTPLLKRYLWALGEEIHTYKIGELLAGRYLLIAQQVLLDTKPALSPDIPDEIPPSVAPYLKLSPYKLHIPQIYGLLAKPAPNYPRGIWLLEQVPIYNGGGFSDVSGQIMPEITRVWSTATALSQLHWLWQIAQLWEPLQINGVASSLLEPTLLRLEGSLVRLLELQSALQYTPSLQNLGQLWSKWLPTAHPKINKFLEQVCQQLISGQVQTSAQLVAILEQGLVGCGSTSLRSYQVIAKTDKGPSRRRNEDACYPTPSNTSSSQPLAIVCDGIGGHEGGDVASSMAIETLVQQVQNLLTKPKEWNPTNFSLALESSVCAANDRISQRNDSEQRNERQRMGTTIVMALAYAHEMYITHVGDSRVYRLTRAGCHQVTLDDDLASREVRLGYAIYRDALQNPTSGALVQALGMSSSVSLHPTVQRFVVDEDCIFLLCSDGLSDNDRVEQYWETKILPILENKLDLATAAQQLIELANTQNGHDNATVALVYCQVTSGTEAADVAPVAQMEPLPVSPPPASQSQNTAQIKTQQPSRPIRPSPLLVGSSVLSLGLLSGALVYFWQPLIESWLMGKNPDSEPQLTSSSHPSNPAVANPLHPTTLERGSLIAIKQQINLKQIPPSRFSKLSKTLIAPAGTIWQIQEKYSDSQASLLSLKVCLNGETSRVPKEQSNVAKNNSTASKQLVQPQQEFIISESSVKELLSDSTLELVKSAVGECSELATGATNKLTTPAIPTWEIEKKSLPPLQRIGNRE